jgi:AcrR family transcriptional regulator
MAITGRPRAFDRDAALEAAMLLFWRKGFAATSISDLCDAMDIASPSLYAAFGSKEALYLEAAEHYVQIQGPPVWGQLAQGATARAGVENLMIAGAGILPKSRTTPSGCMAVLAAVSDEWPAPITRAARKFRIQMLETLRSRLQTAVAETELPASTDVEALSRFYLGVFEGMAVQARDGAAEADLRGIAAAAMLAWPATRV